ncbi:hypothetical protein Micbo1qcDRAFT_164168 [Microdochium bolleyi]|uniref:Uncharacterized protein n=1 Tax=Microdochium bolleyi TaxID=196109 RepID=A0A136J0L7_9PEZI|nr:hypothetical protein Micbo1qcDRAFT_164168 [Microdochium bolleyi]
MSNMSRNNSTTSLMGFSVHQPQLGAMLEFFPAMGSQQLDDMIDAYVPGNMSILDKRTTVTMEFFEHSMATGELFKFFMVYPTNAESPASSLQDSGYCSSAFASPVVSEPRWSASTSKKARIGGANSAAATAADFSHIPGMKIMTRDGQDVTNSASRGCKTKEQRDHAHLMRIMKACESCKKKKVRCDPSHKRAAVPMVADAKVKKASKKSASSARTIPASVPPIVAVQPSYITSFDAFMPSFDVAEQDSWEQFVVYDKEDVVVAPSVDVNYDFFNDPAGHFSPSNSISSGFNSGSNSSFASPSQVFTPVQSTDTSQLAAVGEGCFSSGLGDVSVPSVPYMNSDGFGSGNYVDFALYSPESSSGSDDDLSSYSHELKAASSSPGGVSRRGGAQVESRSVSRSGSVSSSPQASVSDTGLESRSAFAQMDQYGFDLGTSQGPELISGVRHSRRRRVLSAAHSDTEGVHGTVGVHATSSFGGQPQMSESLVPCGPQDVPRPPGLQQSVVAGVVVRSSLAVEPVASTIPDATRTSTRSHTRHRSGIVAATNTRSTMGRERLDDSGTHVAAPVMGCALDDVQGLRRQQDSVNATKSGMITTNVNGNRVGTSIPQSSTAAVMSATQGGVHNSPASSSVGVAAVGIENHNKQQSSSPVSGGTAKATSGAVTADQYRDPGSQLTTDKQADHGIVRVCGRAPLSSQLDAGSEIWEQAQQAPVAEPHNDALVMVLSVLAVLALALAQSAWAKVGATAGGSVYDFVAILVLSTVSAAQKTRDLTKLRTPSAGPFKSTTTSLLARGTSTLLPTRLCNGQSTVAGLVARLGGQLGNFGVLQAQLTRMAGCVSLV